MSSPWKEGTIHDVSIKAFSIFSDDRGWLAELFRRDEIAVADFPAMGYLSSTFPGFARGPHEHHDQTDRFGFFSGHYRLFLWDAREDSPTSGKRHIVDVGANNPVEVIIPPGVVHAYRNVGSTPAFVLNFPDRLYAGEGKAEPVDEIRHEDREDSLYEMP